MNHVFSKNSEIPGLSLGLESQAGPRILAVPKSSYGTQIPGSLGTGTKIFGTVPGFRALELKSLRQNPWDWQSHPWCKFMFINGFVTFKKFWLLFFTLSTHLGYDYFGKKYLNEIFVCYHAYECTVVRAFFTYVNFEPFRFWISDSSCFSPISIKYVISFHLHD